MKSTIKSMAKHNLPLKSNDGLFHGLASQNMLFHQCISELIDNSIAAKTENQPFRIDVIFEKRDNDSLQLFIVDNSKGMSFETLTKAIQVGVSATTENRLNEHGFGLKNALATLTDATGYWKIFSKDSITNKISSIECPYTDPLEIEDDDTFPTLPYHINNIATIINVEVKLNYVQDVQVKGAPTSDLNKLRKWLMEHLGVLYRGYLLPDETKNYNIDGSIYISISNDIQQVNPIEIPMGVTNNKDFVIELGGVNYKLFYKYGALDVTKAKHIGLKAYYQNNQTTQGIDIRLGKRVIATKNLENIWKVKPHNDYNSFVGELIILENVPRGVLRTVTTKTNFKEEDKDWIKIFEYLNKEYPLTKDPRSKTEDEFKEKLKNYLESLHPGDIVTREKCVWPTGVQIDVFWQKNETKEITIYEVKTATADALDLYQLKMYWDGLVSQKEFPSHAWLVCKEFKSPLEEMVKALNLMTPQNGSKPYNFALKTLGDLHLI